MTASQMYIVIGIFLFMIVSFTLNKWPFGLTTMTCCALLVLTGIYPITKAFSGFAMKNLVLIAGMYVVVDAFGRTSLLTKIREKVTKLQSTSTFVLLLILMVRWIRFLTYLRS
jgi:di/tricarboxylate transporter